MKTFRRALALLALFLSFAAQAAVIDFSGPLRIIETDEGGAIYSGVPIGTQFSGSIDDVTANGSITGAGITTNFGCCIAAGGLEFTNNVVLDGLSATLLNTLSGTTDFAPGQIYDLADLEGDTLVLPDGRIEVGLSFLFPEDTYANDDPGNILDPTAALLTVFFIVEEASGEIYSSIGLAVVPIPVPGALWLFGSALGYLAWRRGRSG